MLWNRDGASSWDAIRNPESHEITHPELVSSSDPDRHRTYHGKVVGRESTNNVLGNEANNITTNVPELGKTRDEDPTDPGSHP